MYVMCLFQQLPTSNIIIEDQEKTNDDNADTMETKVCRENQKSIANLFVFQTPSENGSDDFTNYQTNMERVLKWLLKLEEDLDQQDQTPSNDLQTVKEQFQNHEVKFK